MKKNPKTFDHDCGRSILCPAQLVKCRPLEISLPLDAWREGEREREREREIANQSFFNKNRQTVRGVH